MTVEATNSESSRKPPPPIIGDFPPSDLRRRPLTAAELRDIRSLIGVAKGNGDGDGAAGKRSSGPADGAPRPRPLAGRRVMVPMTSKALFDGVLQPRSAGADAASEQVLVNCGGKLVEMTRLEAEDYFNKQSASSATKPQTEKSSSKSKAVQPSQTTATRKGAQPGMGLPMMEIRETCDIGGNIINSEVVDMTKTIVRLGDGLKNVNDTADGEEEGKQLGELLARTLKAGEGDIATDLHVTHADAHNEGTDKTEVPKPAKKETISDVAYAAICSRLEELEKLEEEDEKSKKENAKSSKRLQSSGWSKGFLNNTKKKSSSQRKGRPKRKDTTTSNKSPNQQRLDNTAPGRPKPNCATLSNETADTIASSYSAVSTENVSKVSFSGNNEVKEIPRIGQSKVPPRPTSSQRRVPLNPSNLEVPDVDPFSPITTIPFEENIFKGVVKERGASTLDSAREGKELRESAPQSNSGVGSKKKLSRFAQQRLQR
ncbi:hypothetical protein ACHAWF_008781 [Thalassiosira exigua]